MKLERIDIEKKYSIIYIYPPWSYDESNHNRTDPNKSAEGHYNTVHIDELMEWDFSHICEKDCLMFMWIVSPNLDQAIDLGKAWGFEYKTIAFVWDKVRVVPGNYTMSQVELCLVFKKGKIPQPRGERNIHQYVISKSGKHSKKPDEIRDRIHQMFPLHKKIEIFARHTFDNWDVWGNEVDSSNDQRKGHGYLTDWFKK